MDTFLEIIGFGALKGTVLLSSEMTPSAAARLPGDLLVVVGESDKGDVSLTEGVKLFHERAFPRQSVETLVVPGANHALCDTTVADWTGYDGRPGTCHVDASVYEAMEGFLRRASRD